MLPVDPHCELSEAGGRNQDGTREQCVLHHQICELPSDELARMEELQFQEAVAAPRRR
jgi:hypothetical protein